MKAGKLMLLLSVLCLLMITSVSAYNININTYDIDSSEGVLSDKTNITVSGTDITNLTAYVSNDINVMTFENIATDSSLSINTDDISSTFASLEILTLTLEFSEENVEELVQYNIQADFLAPETTILTEDNLILTETTVEIEYSVTDDLAEGVYCELLTALDRQEFEFAASEEVLVNQTNSFEFNDFEYGEEYDYIIECFDNGFNSDDTGTQSFTAVDNEAPTVTLTETENITVNNPDFTVEFTVEDNLAEILSCQLYLGLSEETVENVDEGFFAVGSTQELLAEELQTSHEFVYYIQCTDGFENHGYSEILSVSILDITAPSIDLVTPIEDIVYPSPIGEYNLNATITDDFASAEFLDGTTVVTITYPDQSTNDLRTSQNGDEFFTEVFLDQDGWHSIEVNTSDAEGNEASTTIEFAFDNAAPVIHNVTTPSEISSFDEFSFEILASDSIADTLSCQMVLDDSEFNVYESVNHFYFGSQPVESNISSTISMTEEAWLARVGSLPKVGEHEFFVTCGDGNQNTGNAIQSGILIDFYDPAPVIEIISPQNYDAFGEDYLSGDELINITFSVTDSFIESELSYVEVYIQPLSDIAEYHELNTSEDGTYSLEWNASHLEEDQEVELYISAEDNAFNYVEEVISIFIDTVNPNATVASFPEIVGQRTESITVNVENEFGIYTVYVQDSNNNTVGSQTTTLPETSEIEVSLDLSSIAHGNHTFTVFATDPAGNTGFEDLELSDTFTTFVDGTVPNITAFSCTDVTQNTATSCSCSAEDDAESIALGSTVTTVVTGNETSVTGTITASCTATDSQGNSATTTTDFTVSAPTSSSSGGGGGGSSRSSTTTVETPEVICTENWVCLSWNSCQEDSQTRECYDANACEFKVRQGVADSVVTKAKPSEVRACTVEAETTVSTTADDLNTNSNTEEENQESLETEAAATTQGNFLTGAITGLFGEGAQSNTIPIIAATLLTFGVLVAVALKLKK